jgi:anaerobic ribonucleoside-triphosphate reductase activating protein
MSRLLNLAGTVGESIVDGPGIRFVVFAQGCSFDCPGCQNPQTHAFGTGVDRSVEELVAEIRRNPLVKGVSFSGGDPFFQAEAFSVLAGELEASGHEIAAYTGFLWEDLVTRGTSGQRQLLQHLDVLVDGPFIRELRNPELKFRGSENQRIIDVRRSLLGLARTGSASPFLVDSDRWAKKAP